MSAWPKDMLSREAVHSVERAALMRLLSALREAGTIALAALQLLSPQD